MATIEERAKEYMPDAFDENEVIPAREGHIVNVGRSGYIAGAKDQKAIDDAELQSMVAAAAKEAKQVMIDRAVHLCRVTGLIKPDTDEDEIIEQFKQLMED